MYIFISALRQHDTHKKQKCQTKQTAARSYTKQHTVYREYTQRVHKHTTHTSYVIERVRERENAQYQYQYQV